MYGGSIYFDISKARLKLGWVLRYSKPDVRRSYEWYLTNRAIVLADAGAASRHRSAVAQGALKLLHWFL
jgi:hypothetical protein